MSSLRNAYQRRPHRERAQPHERRKLGLLEKHKDYAARARDYNAKKARIRTLEQKAVERNPDEFHFGMMSSRTNKGVKIADRGNKALSHEAVKLLKTQDAGYLRTMAMRTTREKERLMEQITITDGKGAKRGETEVEALKSTLDPKSKKHTVFVDDVDAQKKFDHKQWLDTDQQGRSNAQDEFSLSNGISDKAIPVNAQKQKKQVSIQQQEEERLRSKRQQFKEEKTRDEMQAKRRLKLENLQIRERDLLAAERELELQRAKMSNTISVNNKGSFVKKLQRKR